MSQFHSSLTAGSSPASRRSTRPRRMSVRCRQPEAQCSHTLGTDTRSYGRDRNRYAAPVSAPDRADLHGVAGEVGVERLALGGADHLGRTAPDELDERVPRDLLRRPGAPGAGDTALAVQEHFGGDGDRLFEGPLFVGEPGLAPAVGHGLVLQRALAALVAHRAVQRVVDEQQLHHAVLGLVRDGRGELGAHHHALGARGDARGHRLDLALDLDQALAAGADRVEQRVVAEPRDLDAEQLGGPDDQHALRHRDLEPVDGDGHRALRGLHGHDAAHTVDAAGSKGQPPSFWCCRNSSLK